MTVKFVFTVIQMGKS